jgi:hypothetical protein
LALLLRTSGLRRSARRKIQTLLKLEAIGETRSALNTAQNRLQTLSRNAEGQVGTARDTLQRHLQVSAFQSSALLGAVNLRRQILGVPAIESLTADTKLDDGLAAAAKSPAFNKQSALRDLDALKIAITTIDTLGEAEAKAIVAAVRSLEADPALLAAVQQRALIEKGLELVVGPDCPLCDSPFEDEDHLRGHLEAKLAKSNAARVQTALLDASAGLTRHIANLDALIVDARKVAASQEDTATQQVLTGWATDLAELRTQLATQDGLMDLKDRLTEEWPRLPAALSPALAKLQAKVEALADQSATIDAQTFVATAQMRLEDYRGAMRGHEAAKLAAKSAKATYDAYCKVMAAELDKLYEAVQGDFSTFKRS